MKKLYSLILTTLLATTGFSASAITYEALDPTAVKEGKYVITAENSGKYYMMKNETYSNYYVTATETTLDGTETPTDDYIFTIAKSGEGYTIQGADGKYVNITKNGTKYNLTVGNETSDAVWAFTDNSGKTEAKYGTYDYFMSFMLFKSKTPEFTTGSKDSDIRPTFYYIGDYTPAEETTTKVASIAEFITNGEAGTTTTMEFTCPLSVVYQNGQNLYVTDGTNGMLIYGKTSATYVNGQVFAAGVKGTFKNYNDTYELLDAELTETTEGATCLAEKLTIDQITSAMQNNYVYITDATFAGDSSNGYTLKDATGTVVLYNKGFCELPTTDKVYDVTGFVSYFKKTLQILPIAFDESGADEVFDPAISVNGTMTSEGKYKGAVTVTVQFPEETATSMTITVTKDGTSTETQATTDWTQTYETAGKYTITAVATDGTNFSKENSVEFEILDEEASVVPDPSIKITGLKDGDKYVGGVDVAIDLPDGADSMLIVVKKDGTEIDDVEATADWTKKYTETGKYVVEAVAVAGEDFSEGVSAEFEIADDGTESVEFVLATSVDQLKEGSKALFVCKDGDNYYTLSTTHDVSTEAKQYVKSTTVDVTENKITEIGADVADFTIGKSGEYFTFYSEDMTDQDGNANPGYICSYSSSKNALGIQTELADNGKWAVTISDSQATVLAQGEYDRNSLMYNYNAFRCYNPTTTGIKTSLSIYVLSTSSVSKVASDNAKIVATTGAVNVYADNARAEVYTLTGAKVNSTMVNGEATINLAAGLYIVRVGNTVAKVIVK